LPVSKDTKLPGEKIGGCHEKIVLSNGVKSLV